MAIRRVGGRGQVTIPSGVREALGIREGRKMVCYVNEAGDIVLHPLPAPQPVDEVAGACKARNCLPSRKRWKKNPDGMQPSGTTGFDAGIPLVSDRQGSDGVSPR